MSIKIIPRWTLKEGLGLGVAVHFPYRCAEVQADETGTIVCAGIGLGLIVARVYIDITWGFRPFNP